MRRSISTCSAGKRGALAQAAGGIHAEEHAAPSGCFIDDRGSDAAALFAGGAGPRSDGREVVRVQEEPRNMGPFFYVMPRLTQLAQERGLVLRSVKRSSSASPATGSAKAHELEQKTLVSLAFITSSAS
jgi:2-oxoglutarate dehydrogenase C-terminal